MEHAFYPLPSARGWLRRVEIAKVNEECRMTNEGRAASRDGGETGNEGTKGVGCRVRIRMGDTRGVPGLDGPATEQRGLSGSVNRRWWQRSWRRAATTGDRGCIPRMGESLTPGWTSEKRRSRQRQPRGPPRALEPLGGASYTAPGTGHQLAVKLLNMRRWVANCPSAMPS